MSNLNEINKNSELSISEKNKKERLKKASKEKLFFRLLKIIQKQGTTTQ
ncbi:MAG: hypothetical protein ACPGKG_08310 [Paracoccaceae bacterium]